MTSTLRLAVAWLALATSARAADDLAQAAGRAAAELGAAFKSSPERPAVRQILIAPLVEAPAAAGLGRVVEEALATRLAAETGVPVMDREKLSAVVGEQKLASMLGSGRSGGEEDLARLVGAQALVQGLLQESGGRLSLALRLTTAPGGKVIGTARQEADLPARAREARPGSVESGSVEIAMRKLADGLAAGFARLPGSAKYRRLAVLSFGEVGEQTKKRQVGAIVTAEIATNLQRDHGLLLVERTKLSEVLGELKLQQSLGVDAAQAGRIGEMADAQGLVLGTVAEAGDRFLVNARIVSTLTGETLAAESQSVAAAGMISLASDAVVLRSRSGAVFRSLLVPGFGQFYNRQTAKGWLVIGTEVAALGSALAFHLAGDRTYSEYQEVSRASGTSPSAEAERLYDSARSRYRTRDWLLVAAGAVWVANVADAYLSGVDGESLLGGGGAGFALVPTGEGAVAVASLRF